MTNRSTTESRGGGGGGETPGIFVASVPRKGLLVQQEVTGL
jgi:hypothetical protein